LRYRHTVSEIHDEIRKSVSSGMEAGGFFASILSGFLLGLLGDWAFDTEPLLVVVGIIAGSATGFWRMWQYAKRQDDAGR
jgi:F0F1-type ATP synthase assembly protein I